MNQQRDGRLGIGIIGAGKVGPILGAALAGAESRKIRSVFTKPNFVP